LFFDCSVPKSWPTFIHRQLCPFLNWRTSSQLLTLLSKLGWDVSSVLPSNLLGHLAVLFSFVVDSLKTHALPKS